MGFKYDKHIKAKYLSNWLDSNRSQHPLDTIELQSSWSGYCDEVRIMFFDNSCEKRQDLNSRFIIRNMIQKEIGIYITELSFNISSKYGSSLMLVNEEEYNREKIPYYILCTSLPKNGDVSENIQYVVNYLKRIYRLESIINIKKERFYNNYTIFLFKDITAKRKYIINNCI